MNTNDVTNSAEHQLITPMSQEEARDYTEQIRKGLEGIKSVPRQLLNMEQRQGFSALEYATWREWAKNEYPQHSQGYLYRLLSAAKAKVNLDFDPTIVETDIPVSHLYQLSRLPDEQQSVAYHQANELAAIEERSRIARHVKDVVDRMLPPKPTKVRDTNDEPSTEDEEHDVADDDTDIEDSSAGDNSTNLSNNNPNHGGSPLDSEVGSVSSHFNQSHVEHGLNNESAESGDSNNSTSATPMNFVTNDPGYSCSSVEPEVDQVRNHFNQLGNLDEFGLSNECGEFGDSFIYSLTTPSNLYSNNSETATPFTAPEVTVKRAHFNQAIAQPNSEVLSAVESCLEQFTVLQEEEQLTGKVCLVQTQAQKSMSVRIEALLSAYDQGCVTEAIALVPLSEQIFVKFASQLICPLSGNTVAIYFGKQIDKFAHCFKELGKTWHQYGQWIEPSLSYIPS